MNISKITVCFLIGVFFAQTVFYYPNLPELIASRFDGADQPSQIVPKISFFLLEIALLILIVSVFSIVPRVISAIPNKFINIPNRDYWLAPQLREITFEMIKINFEWFSCMFIAFFIAVNQIVIESNLSGKAFSPRSVWLILIAFFGFVVLWFVKFLRQFKIAKYES